MRRFTDLLARLELCADDAARETALAEYFRTAEPQERAAALALLGGPRPRRAARSAELSAWVAECAGVPDWLAALCREVTGDSAEALAYLLPPPDEPEGGPGLDDLLTAAAGIRAADAIRRKEMVLDLLLSASPSAREVILRVVSGTFRPFRLRRVLFRAAGGALGMDAERLAWRQSGDPAGPPYPFEPAIPAPEVSAEERNVQFLPPGIRCQILRRTGGTAVWAEDCDLVSRRCEDVRSAASALPPGTVLEGVLSGRGSGARFTALDLLEADGRDVRSAPLSARLARLFAAVGPGSAQVRFAEIRVLSAGASVRMFREEARRRGMSGVLVRGEGAAGVWSVLGPAQHFLDLVLLDVEGERRFTFAARSGDDLVPVVRGEFVLDPETAAAVREHARSGTIERFGPVRRVAPGLVFRISCDAVRPSSRRRCGVRLDNPGISQWLKEASPSSAAALEDLRCLAAAE